MTRQPDDIEFVVRRAGDDPFGDKELRSTKGFTSQDIVNAVNDVRNSKYEQAFPNGTLSFGAYSELRDHHRRAKGGVIGTGGVGAVALRFDHHTDTFISVVLPELQSRGLPASLCLMGNKDLAGDNTASWATLQAMAVANGVEWWNHSEDHLDPETQGYSFEIVQGHNDLVANLAPLCKVQGFMPPGVGDAVAYSNNFASIADLASLPAALLRSVEPVFEGGLGSVGLRWLPTGPHNGAGHVTGDTVTLASLKGYMDRCAIGRMGLEVLWHPVNIGTVNGMSLADFRATLDYLVAYRDAGKLAAITSSGLLYADPSVPRRNWLQDGRFAGLTAGIAKTGQWSLNAGAGITFPNDGTAYRGTGYAHFPATATIADQGLPHLDDLGIQGETSVAGMVLRAPGAGATGRLRILDTDDNTRINIDYKPVLTAGQDWTLYLVPHTMPLNTVNLQYSVGRGGGDQIDVGEVFLWKA